MALNRINFELTQRGKTRAQVRREVVEKFLEESPGPASDEVYNRYEYIVEETPEGRILLTRPANLKLGFDYRIDVEGMTFMKGTVSPTHQDIFKDLKFKNGKNPDYAERVRKALVDVYEMAEPEDILPKIQNKEIGYSPELLLKLAKWFAIEQDIRYWNGWGRVKNVTWFNLLKFFNYKYEVVKKKNTQEFIFYDSSGNKLSEKKATELMNNS